MFPLTQTLIHGTLLSLVFGVIVIASLRWNPRIWLHDFPAAIRATQPPLSTYEQQQQRSVSLIFFAAIILLPLLFNAQLRASLGSGFTLGVAYAHTWLMFQMVNLFDAVVLDWGYIVLLHPRHLHWPGSEQAQAALRDGRWHVLNYLKGVVIVSVFALPFALVALL